MKPAVLAVLVQIDYSSLWRIVRPFEMLWLRGYTADMCTYDDLRTKDISEYDVIVTPRLGFSHRDWLAGFFQEVMRSGKQWVIDADDDIWCDEIAERQYVRAAPVGRRNQRRIKAQGQRYLEERRAILRDCSMVTVTTEALAARARVYTDAPVKVVPNRIDVRGWREQAAQKDRVVAPLTVGWAGGWRLDADFEPLPAAWTEIAARHPEVRFVIYGHCAPNLAKSVPEDRLTLIEWTSTIDVFPSTLKNIDIMCCVLTNTEYNRGKSCNKWLEASLIPAASVVSPTVYGDVVQDGRNALVADTAEEWVECLERLIVNPDYRAQIALRAHGSVVAWHNLNSGWPNWIEAWQRYPVPLDLQALIDRLGSTALIGLHEELVKSRTDS